MIGTGSQRTYVWGMTNEMLPGDGNVTYLVEQRSEERTAYNLLQHAPVALRVYTLVGGLWQFKGNFPVAARPVITYLNPNSIVLDKKYNSSGSRGAGSYTQYAELTLSDIDHDGWKEVLLEVCLIN